MRHTNGLAAIAANHIPVPDLGEKFLEFLNGVSYPCVGAKSALARGLIETHEFGRLGDRDNDRPLMDGLSQFVRMIEANTSSNDIVHSYVAIFRGPHDMNELRFESLLWSQLWRIHRLDVLAGNKPACDVSADADSAQFSLSMAGHPFFVIGLHSHASRLARRFSHPVLVFNSHRQFEKLREDGRFAKMQAATRARDIELQGSVNPNLADFGAASEARQYSGREVGSDWQCPYDFDNQP
ncbi:guanitoxin biosynthesis heme-dependent pre-guanitoxin N-hydroxylase GntA [Haliea sp. E1-2-M8]|uniref:guanitoxin biosynthesis heme-dependent pre-guanitoxin N-hydroxylase GntA n=1 Tax=Haliea sp. E1-2-M8 TaxID=3064706 RepID=UPI0027286198|nr:guanitoxin biosynthesis heme-dependent pre-guanitoxin N-hydroxylase GntA [Haliea sp. E1-2-M8]MDO8863117.1 guanitoxin biosynthesis heme-dependent pre-guanitoxin N-hydroxylase GntA [Haliea sp. E1-2-M8]